VTTSFIIMSVLLDGPIRLQLFLKLFLNLFLNDGNSNRANVLEFLHHADILGLIILQYDADLPPVC
jgi:hypothetical protein